MKTKSILLLLSLSVVLFSCQNSKYKAESVKGDPYETKVYTLENGLKIYVSPNPKEPRISAQIAVRTGSKNDPSDCTGLAHYLEHMLFKGNSHFGSANWEKEKVYLKEISDLFELHKKTENQQKKDSIYHVIDSISYIASTYTIANEYDKMVKSLGAQGTNAYTWVDQTVYINDIPTPEFEKWLKIESTRFSELTLRLFHTELEAVYEEFNMGQDNDYRKVSETMDKLLFPNHPYGTQSTIGLGEHLKNPSMVKIHEYFDTYYVPNNMAICLAGDVPENAVELIAQYFGGMKSKALPVYESKKADAIATITESKVVGPMP
jgi:zinc protease